jgi:peptidoglycan/LPS O-acetylase OafA/YrhL
MLRFPGGAFRYSLNYVIEDESLRKSFFGSFGLLISPLGVIVNRVIRFYGEISYSLCLNYPVIIYVSSPVFAWFYAHAWPVFAQYGFCLVLTLSVLTVLSLVTYRFVEKPGMRLGSLLIKNLCAPGWAKLSDPIVKAVV